MVQLKVEDTKGKALRATPADHFVKICHDQLEALMGPVDTSIRFKPKGTTGVMMVGLQGSGKTTTAAKLANKLLKEGKKPLLVAADVYRPAAVDQLKVLGEKLGVPVYHDPAARPPQMCKRAFEEATRLHRDVVIMDTAGRLAIDEDMMRELEEIKASTEPQNILLVADAMIGQDAVKTAAEFDRRLTIDGFILTKLDGDARGGAALSVKAVTGKPIKFIGVGEKLDKLEEFHPDRMAGRILGMGDVVTLVEKAQEQFDEEETKKMQAKMAKGTFGFDDFLKQMQGLRKMGGMASMLKMLPGMGQLGNMDIDDSEINKIEGIIHSMTPQERKDPDLISASRRRRIARGCGREVQDIAGLIKMFMRSRDMMKALSGGAMGGFGSLMSGKLDMFSAMNSGRKIKQRSKRKKEPRKKKNRR